MMRRIFVYKKNKTNKTKKKFFSFFLGQVLFFPPNVAGWKGGQNWIDSSSLILRLNMPHSILNNSGMDVQAKPAFEEDPLESFREKKIGVIKSDWIAFASNFIH